MKFEFTQEEVDIVIESLQSRKSRADGRKGFTRYCDTQYESKISDTIAPLLARLRGVKSKFKAPPPPPAAIVDIVPSLEAACAEEIQRRWNLNEPCLYGCGPMTRVDAHNRICPKCDFRQWSTVAFEPAVEEDDA